MDHFKAQRLAGPVHGGYIEEEIKAKLVAQATGHGQEAVGRERENQHAMLHAAADHRRCGIGLAFLPRFAGGKLLAQPVEEWGGHVRIAR